MDERKPVAWLCVWNGEEGECTWAQYHGKFDPLPEEWDETPDEIEPYYDQQAIDTLLAEIARRTEQVKQVTSNALSLMAELGELRSDYSRCRVAADKLSERELLFGAHEDLQARAERAEAELSRIGGDVRALYDLIPGLPITAATADAATYALIQFCIDFHAHIDGKDREQNHER